MTITEMKGNPMSHYSAKVTLEEMASLSARQAAQRLELTGLKGLVGEEPLESVKEGLVGELRKIMRGECLQAIGMGNGYALVTSPIVVQGLIVDTELYRKEDLSANSIKALDLLFFKPYWADLLRDKFDLLRWFNSEFKDMIKKGARW